MIFAIINYVLAACAAAAGASGLFFKDLRDKYDVFDGFTGLIPPALALLFVFWRSMGKSAKPPAAHCFLWPAALVLVSRTLFTSAELQNVYPALLCVSVALPALVRKEPVWIIAFAFASVFYSGQLSVEHKIWIEGPPGGDEFYYGLAKFAAASLLAGFLPWIILKKRADAQEKEFNKTLEEVRDSAIASAMTRAQADGPKKSGGPDTAAVSAMSTMKLSSPATDTLALFTGGGDEVNVQLKTMLSFMRGNFKAHTACAFIYDASKRVLVLNCYDTKGGVQVLERAQIPFGAGAIGQAASDNRIFMSGDLSLYQGSGHTYYAQDEGVFSILAAPIVANSAGRELLGVLAVDSQNKHAFTDTHHELMKRFSMIAAALIVNIRMNLSLEQAAKTFRIFYEVSHKFSIALKTDDIFKVIVDEMPQLIPSCTRQIIILHDEQKNTLRLQHIAGAKGELAEGLEFPPSSGGIYSYAFNKNSAVNLPDLQAQRTYRFVREETPNPTVRSLLVIPIIGEDRKCIGLYSIETNVPGVFRGAEEQQLTTIIENASVAITRSQLYLKMEKLATTDGLTGLNNHRTFQEIMARELERSKRYGRPLSVLLTDIDHFKSFNDTYGHPVGDLVLREIAGCIAQTVRLNDFPARYGGEEFAVVLPETDAQGAMIIAERIRVAIEARVIDSGPNKLRVTISIGCNTFPTYGTNQQEIIDCADKALYASKKGGRNRVTLFNPQMTVGSK
jgi:diguanylate cyclase (GGDEF)-like protein